MSRPAWEALADALLQREALLCRFGEGVPPRDLAGWFVAPEDVDRILRTLPGLDGPSPEVAAPLLEQLDGYLVDARQAFTTSMAGDSRLADLARRASLSDADAEALALLAAVELHPQRQRLVGYIQDSVQLPRLSLATLDRILGSTAGALLVAPDAALRRGQLVDVEEQGPWAVRMCSVPPRVAWYLRGDAAPDRDLPPGTRRLIAVRGSRPKPDLLIISGADRETRLRVVKRNWPDVSVLLTSMPAATEGWAALVREATVTGSAVVLELEVPRCTRRRDRSWSAPTTWPGHSARPASCRWNACPGDRGASCLPGTGRRTPTIGATRSVPAYARRTGSIASSYGWSPPRCRAGNRPWTAEYAGLRPGTWITWRCGSRQAGAGTIWCCPGIRSSNWVSSRRDTGDARWCIRTWGFPAAAVQRGGGAVRRAVRHRARRWPPR